MESSPGDLAEKGERGEARRNKTGALVNKLAAKQGKCQGKTEASGKSFCFCVTESGGGLQVTSVQGWRNDTCPTAPLEISE